MEAKRFKNIERIWGVPGQPLEIGKLTGIIEDPLIQPIETLLKKGIKPYWSSANNVTKLVAIIIDRHEMNNKNLEIARLKFSFEDTDERVIIQMDNVNQDTLESEITSFFNAAVDLFEEQ